jgi:hypothetical protein
MPTTIEIQPIKIGDEHYVAVSIGGTAMNPRGPFQNTAEAEIVAERMRRVGRALTSSRLSGA